MRYIVHVDMDAFFASIEQRDNPGLKGKPVIVGADPKGGKARGVVSTCSYEARAFGVHSAMPISLAYKKCPCATFLPVNMKKYVLVSRQMYNILYGFTPVLEPVGIDEAFLDISASCHLFGGAHNTCLALKSRIRESLDLTASVGLAPNKMTAKIASDMNKPDGLTEVDQDNLIDFIRPLDIRRLWGLGPKAAGVLNGLGVRTIGDLASREKRELIRLFGKVGHTLYELARGIDASEVKEEVEEKSLGNETTFDVDTSDQEEIKGVLLTLCEQVSSRLRARALKGKHITLKLRFCDFSTYTRSTTLSRSTNFADTLYHHAKKLYDLFLPFKKKVRLVGVRVSGLVPSQVQESIFKERGEDKRERIHRAIENIHSRLGKRYIFRAASSMYNRKRSG